MRPAVRGHGRLRTWLILVGAAVPALTAQQPPATGTARIAGVVVSADAESRPIRRALVRLSGGGDPGRSAITDDEGRFEIAALPAGRVTLSVSKPTYLTTPYGSKGPGKPGTPIVLAAGQALTDVRIALPRGGVIAGTVRDRRGEPAADVQITALRADLAVPLPATPVDENTIRTDDRGVFRVYGLAPGEYFIAAQPRVPGTGETTAPTRAEVDAELQTLQAAASRPTISTAAIGAGSPRRPTHNYVPVFFPGATDAGRASKITVAVGQEVDGIDITLALVPTAVIEGVVRRPDAQPLQVTVDLSQTGVALPVEYGLGATLSLRPGPDGAFRYANVPPGTYTLVARTTAQTVRGGGPGVTMVSGDRNAPGPGVFMWASTTVTVSGNDVSGVTLALRRGITVSGSVVFDAATLRPPEGAARGRLLLSGPLETPTGVAGPSAPSQQPYLLSLINAAAAVGADGSFQLQGLIPGTYRLTADRLNLGPAGWWLRSAILASRDLLDGPVEVGDADVAGLVVTFSDRHTELAGTLQTAAGQPDSEFFVVAIPADRTLWRSESRRMRFTRPDTTGRYSFADLPPGEYLLAALTDLNDRTWQTPAVLEQIAAAGVRTTIGEGERKVQDLRIGR